MQDMVSFALARVETFQIYVITSGGGLVTQYVLDVYNNERRSRDGIHFQISEDKA